MVSEIVGRLGGGGGRDRDRARDRGQLLLVAAIAIAFIVLGIVVVLNSTLYTQSIASDNSIERTGDVETMELEVERGIRGYIQGVNRVGGATETNDLNNAVEAFATTYRSATADSGPKLVNVGREINDDDVETGTLITTDSMESLTGDSNNATVYNSTNGALGLEHFVLTLEVDEFDGVYVVFGNDSGDEHSVLFESENGDGNIPVDSNGNSCELDPEGSETVTIDLLRGQTDATTDNECLTEIAEGIDGSYDEVSFVSDEGDGDIGWFELVVDADDDDAEIDESDGRYSRTAALTLNLPLTYDSSDLTYDRTLEVEVYGSESLIDTYGDAKPYGEPA